MRHELEFLTDDQLLAEIKRLRYEWAGLQENMDSPDRENSIAFDYLILDIQEYMESVEKEYKSRGLLIPDDD